MRWCILLLHVSSAQHSKVLFEQANHEDRSGTLVRPVAKDALDDETALGAQLGFVTTSLFLPHASGSRPAHQQLLSHSSARNGTIVIDTEALSSTVSPLTIYARSFQKWLQEAPYQEIIAVLAIAVGSVFLWDGPALWHFLFTGAIAVAGAFVAYEEGKAVGLASSFASEVFLALEVGCVVGYATHCGFEGTQVMLGAGLGCLGAYGMSAGPRSLDAHFPGVLLAWYSAGAMLGLLVYTTWRQSVLATFAPLLGGIFVASGCGVLLSRLCLILNKKDSAAADGAVWFPSHDATWIEVLESLIGNGGGGITLAALCGCALLGAVAQSMSGNRTIAIFLILGGIAFSTLAASACQLIEKSSQVRCPGWLTTTAAWQWLVVGSVLWASTTGISAYCQLGKHDSRLYDYGSSRSTYFSVNTHGGRRQKETAATYYMDAAAPPAPAPGYDRFVTLVPQDGGGYA